MRLCILLCFISLLVGCAEQPAAVFGMPVSQWNQLSEKQRQDIIEQYNVTKLSHYKTEAKTTMTPAAPDNKTQPQLSILDEPQKTAAPAAIPTAAPKKVEAPASSKQNPTQDSWLQLNS